MVIKDDNVDTEFIRPGNRVAAGNAVINRDDECAAVLGVRFHRGYGESVGIIAGGNTPLCVYADIGQRTVQERGAGYTVNIAVTEYQYFFTFFPGLEHPVYRVFHVFEEEGIMKVAEIVLKKVENVGAVNNVPSGKN
jgi:hypothetical protein